MNTRYTLIIFGGGLLILGGVCASLLFSQKTEPLVYTFPKPNIEWKTRTKVILGKIVTYNFGEGNPPEVSLSQKDIAKIHSTGNGYMIPEAELELKKFLENPYLPEILSKCSHVFDITNQNQKPDWMKFPSDLDMEHILIIDPNTGRKEFSETLFFVMYEGLSAATNPLVSEPDGAWKSCLGEDYPYAVKLFEELSNAFSYYKVGKL